MFYCDGVETCENGECVNGDPIECPDGEWCEEVSESCVHLDNLWLSWYVFILLINYIVIVIDTFIDD